MNIDRLRYMVSILNDVKFFRSQGMNIIITKAPSLCVNFNIAIFKRNCEIMFHNADPGIDICIDIQQEGKTQ